MLSPRDIIEEDLRNVEFNGNWVCISQVETMNNRELKKREIIEELERINMANPFNLRLVMLTDVLKNDCILLVVGKDIPLLEEELNTKIIDNSVYLPNVVSRKKQILPILEKIYKKG
jgi:manganese-dependent inorganic pyrophosphatase